jgi:hypothetical protein
MPQQTNLNVNPYYDDFDPAKDYYRVLFKPGFPIQARELTTLQSILQNQLESFGSHIFKEGSIVVPGNVTYDDQYYAVEINSTHLGTDVSVYINNFVGKRIVGQESGVSAQVQYVLSQTGSERNNVTLYVKYIDSGNTNNALSSFSDGENLETLESVDYGNTTIPTGNTFATCISENATSIGSAAHIGAGIMFLRGTFARVDKQTILLDQYSNQPSYRVGLVISETVTTAKDDSSLYDNAKGFSNYTAPGADRLKIQLVLGKKAVTDTTDVNFIELLRVENGEIRKIIKSTDYSIIRDYLAKRTFDESGDYSVEDFELGLFNSLNDRLGNDGLYFSNQSTSQGNIPNDDLACLKVGPGVAYVRGYDVEKNGTEIIDVNKTRATKEVKTSAVDFEMGNLVKLNHVVGIPKFKDSVQLYDQRRNNTGAGIGTQIGEARVYTLKPESQVSIALTDTTIYDCYLYDIQTYTRLELNSSLSAGDLPDTSYIKGLSSGATGYATTVGSGKSEVFLRQTAGSFIQGESISINGISTTPRTVNNVKQYGAGDVRMVWQDSSSLSGYTTDFQGDTVLDFVVPTGFSVADTITINNTGITTSAGNNFTNFKVGDIIQYQRPGFSTATYNRVSSITADGLKMTLSAVVNVDGVCDGSLPSTTTTVQFRRGSSSIRNEEQGFLYAPLDDGNIATVDFTGSDLKAVVEATGKTTNASGVLTLSASDISGLTDILFEAFDEERYSIIYSDGKIEPLRDDQVSISSNVVTFNGLRASQSNVNVIATVRKTAVQNKQKVYNRVRTLEVTRSKYSSSGTNGNNSINDGLTKSPYYGLRVQDKEICLNYPDVANVFAVYQAIDENSVSLDTLNFFTNADINDSVILGENVVGSTSGAVAKVVTKAANQITFVYLNENKFSVQENVLFQESNVIGQIQSISAGRYTDVTNRFTLNKGQKNQYYDYARLVRNDGYSEPNRKLYVVYDHYTVPSNDEGDIFTVDSYGAERFAKDIPFIGNNNQRASDTLDFRPRVAVFNPATATASPFDFKSRVFTDQPKLLLAANESSVIGYTFYAPRIDRLYLDKLGNFVYVEGVAERTPKAPEKVGDVMLLATIELPAYLYDVDTATITMEDNRRYTMRDIGKLEDRIETLEELTSLNLLELETQSLQVQDATGLSRFKSGFFVDNFRNGDFIDPRSVMLPDNGVLRPFLDATTLSGLLASNTNVPDNEIDLAVDFELLDQNVRKTGRIVTLDYTETEYLNQPHATKVENVNPFNVVLYNGSVQLSPKSDFWVRNIWVPGGSVRIPNPSRRGQTASVTRTLSNTADRFMRSRNVQFNSVGNKPYGRYYQFLDGNGGVDVIPKLLEVEDVTGVFQVGETVVGSINGVDIIRFRLARPDHKSGAYATPAVSYTINPYDNTTTLPTQYSLASTVLNVDTAALSAQAQGAYSGRVEVGTRFRGLNSGAQAVLSDIRLIADNGGDLIGSFFLRNPNGSPTPTVRITTGTKEYKLTTSATNAQPLPGSKLISSAVTNYTANGRTIVRQRVTATFYDPLAQSFLIEKEGAFITSIDLFFASKDGGNIPVEVQLRTMELGTPTTTLVTPDARVLVKPGDITTSSNASVATNVKFPSPIYLEPNQEYCVVLLADTDQYEVWVAEMGKKTVNASQLPAATGVVYSTQYSMGSLFLSQNGSIWTANQFEDMTFKLYRANFASDSGTAYFYNPKLDISNSGSRRLNEDPIETFPRKLTVGIQTLGAGASGITTLSIGRKVTSASKAYNFGYVEQQGGTPTSSGVGVFTGGSGYGTPSNPVSTFNIDSNGTGLTLNVTVGMGISNVTAVSVASSGTGYVAGDTVGLTTADMGGFGDGAVITINTLGGIDTLYLTNVQGEEMVVGAGLSYYDDGGVIGFTGVNVLSSSATSGNVTDGSWFFVDHYDHGMYADNNKVTLSKIRPNTPVNILAANLGVDDTVVSLATTTGLLTFEGIAVGAANTGYLVINDEIIAYDSVGVGTVGILQRGVDNTLTIAHNADDQALKYELNGVSLRRINKTHDMGSVERTIDGYYIQVDRSNRNTDDTPNQEPQLSFNTNSLVGGNLAEATQNVQFNYIAPNFDVVTPGDATSVSANIRTVSGTSVNGSEVSFLDQGYEPVGLNTINALETPRLIASKVNEDARTTDLPRNKSFTLGVQLETQSSYVSPYINLDTANLELFSNRIDNPGLNYATDSRVNSDDTDPHSAIYISQRVDLQQPATSLRVLLTAARPSEADFRVLYKLVRADSSEIDQSYELFPGYENLIDTNGDGFGDEVVNIAANTGHPDVLVPPSLTPNDYLEYQFTADNLEQFTGYVIKVVCTTTNQSKVSTFRDIRTIALA